MQNYLFTVILFFNVEKDIYHRLVTCIISNCKIFYSSHTF